MEKRHKGWHSRGYLPHFDADNVTQFITFRLADSLAPLLINRLKFQLDSHQISEIDYHREIEKPLDQGHGSTYLKRDDTASIIEENLLRFDGVRYLLFHWVIMSNHLHLLLKPLAGHTLSSIMHSMKSYTSNRINEVLGCRGRLWSVEYFDRYIRNAEHYERAVKYIHQNPVKAGLCKTAADWKFGCARLHE